MPDIRIETIKQILDALLELKARQEATLVHQEPGAAQEEKYRAILCELEALPKPKWIRFHLANVADHDLRELLELLRSRP